MILPQTLVQSLIVMIVSLVCLSWWATTLKMTGKFRFELYYVDFVVGAVIAMAVYVATLGSLGFDGFSFMDDLLHAGKRSWLFAFLAGLVFNLANMLLVAAISIAGLSVSYSIGAGVGLIVGTGIAQMARREGNPLMLFVGFVFIILAATIAAMIHRARVAVLAEEIRREAKQSKRKHVIVPSAIKGIVLGVVAGLLLAGYIPLLARARQPDIGLGPYAALFMFTCGLFASSPVYTIFFANLPVEGEPVEFRDYIKVKPKIHLIGLAGGILWCTGMLAAFVGTVPEVQAHLGKAIKSFAYGVPLLAASWGVLVFREFRDSAGNVRKMSYAMLAALALGVVLASVAPLFQKAVSP